MAVRAFSSRAGSESWYVGRSIKAGPLWKAVRVQAELEETVILLLRTETCFLGCFVKDVGHRIVSAVTVPGAWADCGD